MTPTDGGAEPPETLLVILGAGASYDCIPDGFSPDGRVAEGLAGRLVRSPGLPDLPFEVVRPPIAQGLAKSDNELINWALNRWPWARPVVDHLRRTLAESSGNAMRQAVSLEEALRDYYDGEGTVPEKKRHLLAMRFYLRDLLWACTSYMLSPDLTGGVTNQVTLLRTVLEWASAGNRQAVIISFNYDLIMERAMESSWEFSAAMLADYCAHDRVKMLKPHGSVQWLWNFAGSHGRISGDALLIGRQSINAAMTGTEERSSCRCVSHATFESRPTAAAEELSIPALAIPIAQKADFCWPIDQQLLFDDIARADKVLTIGWRGLEDHFLEILRPKIRKRTRLLVINGGPEGEAEAKTTAERLYSHVQGNGRLMPDWDGCGFSGLCASDSKRLTNFLGR